MTISQGAGTPRIVSLRGNYRPDIDGLRAFAVVAVIVNHFNRDILPGGYLGVDIFFVISGFVITSSLAESRANNFKDFAASFYSKRVKRLVPALVLFVVVMSILVCLFNPNPGLSLRTGLASLFGLSNLYLLKQSTNYFAASAELNIFTHTWSLGVEEQFYLLFPLLMWVTGFGRLSRRGAGNLVWVSGALLLASVIAFVYLYDINQPAAYFLMPTRLWELASGCILFLGLRNSSGFISPLARAPSLLLLAAIVGVLFLPLASTVEATVAVVCLSVLLIASMRPGTRTYWIFTRQPVVYLGMMSYSLYLWHWGVLSLGSSTVGIHWWSAPILIVLMGFAAALSYRYVEVPLRHAEWSIRPWATVGYGLGGALAAAAIIAGLAGPLDGRLYSGSRHAIETAFMRKAIVPSRSCNIFHDSAEAVSLSSKCGAGSDNRVPTIYLIGDSHINQFGDSIAAYANEKRMNFRNVWGGSCPFPASSGQGHSDECTRLQRQVAESLLGKVKPGDAVFIGNAINGYFLESQAAAWDAPPLSTQLQEDRARSYSIDLRDISDRIIAKGGKVVIYLDGPRFNGLGGERCDVQWFRPVIFNEHCFANARSYRDWRARHFGWLNNWSNGEMTFLWDGMRGDVCDQEICSAVHYVDSNHFARYYADYSFSLFIRENPGMFSPAVSLVLGCDIRGS